MPELKWIGKDKVVNHHLDVPFHTLNAEYTFNPLSDGEGAGGEVGNKIIHADNLLALKSLLLEYEGRIKCIYIDPPYNTGNEGWVYNDNVNDPKIKKWLGQVVGKEAEDLTRHDKWLCMMYPRLKLLHKLLSEDGAIFISIDDNEQANLKLICDEIFGAENFQGSFIVNTTPNARDYGHIGKMHEFCLFYSKKELSLTTNFIPDKEKKFKYSDSISGYNIHPLYNSNVAFTPENRPNLFYAFYLYPDKKIEGDFFEIGFEKTENAIEIFPPKSVKDNVQFVWRWGREKSTEEINKEIIGYQVEDGEYRIVQKMRTSSKVIRSLQIEKDFTSRRGTAEVEELFGKKSFSFPKPIELIKQFLFAASDKNSIILDSFAGSGTTAHAVLNLNKQDGGNRKFILVEMENYAENITAERVKRVINGYADVEGTGGSFTFYTLGETVLDADQNLNPKLALPKIHQYIWYAETRKPYTLTANEAGYLGKFQQTGIYFHYQPQAVTTLDDAYLMHVSEKAEQYIIYADMCLLDEKFMLKHNIIFKKIPRDISKL